MYWTGPLPCIFCPYWFSEPKKKKRYFDKSKQHRCPVSSNDTLFTLWVCLCVFVCHHGDIWPWRQFTSTKILIWVLWHLFIHSQLRDYNHWQVKLITLVVFIQCSVPLRNLEPLCVHLHFNLTHNTYLNIVADWAPLSLLPGGTVRQCDAPTHKNFSRTAQRTSHRGLDLASNSKVLIRLSIYKNTSPGKIPIYRNPPNLAAHVPIPDSTGHPPEVPCPCSNLSELFWASKGDCHNNKTLIFYDQYINISLFVDKIFHYHNCARDIH